VSIKNPQKVSGLFAFWRYDTYPYVLGGVVDMMDDQGLVRVPSYGNAWFMPIKLMPIRKGKELLGALKGPHGLEGQRRQALESFDALWDETLFALFPDARHPNIMRHQKALKEKKRGV
jgi:hypothetical protein